MYSVNFHPPTYMYVHTHTHTHPSIHPPTPTHTHTPIHPYPYSHTHTHPHGSVSTRPIPPNSSGCQPQWKPAVSSTQSLSVCCQPVPSVGSSAGQQPCSAPSSGGPEWRQESVRLSLTHFWGQRWTVNLCKTLTVIVSS